MPFPILPWALATLCLTTAPWVSLPALYTVSPWAELAGKVHCVIAQNFRLHSHAASHKQDLSVSLCEGACWEGHFIPTWCSICDRAGPCHLGLVQTHRFHGPDPAKGSPVRTGDSRAEMLMTSHGIQESSGLRLVVYRTIAAGPLGQGLGGCQHMALGALSMWKEGMSPCSHICVFTEKCSRLHVHYPGLIRH